MKSIIIAQIAIAAAHAPRIDVSDDATDIVEAALQLASLFVNDEPLIDEINDIISSCHRSAISRELVQFVNEQSE